jgi:hypothetical protein
LSSVCCQAPVTTPSQEAGDGRPERLGLQARRRAVQAALHARRGRTDQAAADRLAQRGPVDGPDLLVEPGPELRIEAADPGDHAVQDVVGRQLGLRPDRAPVDPRGLLTEPALEACADAAEPTLHAGGGIRHPPPDGGPVDAPDGLADPVGQLPGQRGNVAQSGQDRAADVAGLALTEQLADARADPPDHLHERADPDVLIRRRRLPVTGECLRGGPGRVSDGGGQVRHLRLHGRDEVRPEGGAGDGPERPEGRPERRAADAAQDARQGRRDRVPQGRGE